MAMTLVEASNTAVERREFYRAGVIRMFSEATHLFNILPFETISGPAYVSGREQALPNVGFRGINEPFAEGVGQITDHVDRMAITGGDLDTDKVLIDWYGQDIRNRHEEMKVRAISLNWARTFIKGDRAINGREFDGLQNRVGGDQLVSAADTPSAGGDPLSLFKMDELRDQVDLSVGTPYYIMNKRMISRLSQAARDPNIGGNINFDINEFGRRVMMWDGIQVVELDKDHEKQLILPFTEPAPADAALTTTSIYLCVVGDMGLMGLQNSDIQVRDLGELEALPVERTRIDWNTTITIGHGESVARLQGITDTPVVP